MLGVAIIGCGDMGTKHAAAWASRKDAKIIAVCDLKTDRAKALSKLYDTLRCDRWQDAIAHDEVDVVSVCVPACNHRDVSVAAACAGRHVLCEKAMALTLEQADEMIAAAESNNVQLSVCHQYRSLSRYRIMKRLINEGRLGAPLFIRFAEMREVRPKLAMHRRSMNGGPLHDMTGHLLDLARYLTGCEAESVSAVGNVFGQGKERLRTVTDFGIDAAEVQVRFGGGHCLSIGLNWGLPENTPGRSQELVHGPMGMIYSADAAQPDRFLGDVSETVCIVIKDASGTMQLDCDRDSDGPHVCIEELVEAIENGTISQFSGREGRAALRLILASLEAIETGKTVTV
ncbi:MAG: Gfo/Idh/MocA family protein [Rhizobiaceae bacterium]